MIPDSKSNINDNSTDFFILFYHLLLTEQRFANIIIYIVR